ncbi:ABC transporter substrate-binding protein [Roseivirga pacifica]|uniref:ABC transporter substrate-binding protein n=2 Tax=Roseivirga pacifica TaxID=1267423 RepID=UPI0020946F8A|nr:helical backbone metal receptor [Roseivirga pacifica]MCO6360131.1 ABC transporter substrate-binding protein [Roseivirga pacifica]MCO6367502.1 ABC transporter substrate-binding protein [Roseivirga pacifica]MCO6369967.1 ABC transporter substrate-binding protein [Roseivirga pacifica]MCO6375158.1 ABC transporter substrate-binding protein [Roseivirga pacifica]MCO6380417.1 ABC transporter substrate-binding protein [Roseivirga pacifica]
MPLVQDQMGRSVEVPELPQRIVSLVPSQTELLYDLGLGDRVVGVTKFCIHPKDWRKTKTIVGGTKNYRFDKIDTLNPDLIIGNKEENEREGIEQLAQLYPVWMSDIYTLADAFEMMRGVGEITGVQDRVEQLIADMKGGFSQLESKKTGKRVLYLIWQKPYMAAGSQTFIDEMLKACGFVNAISEGRYPALTVEEIPALKPDLIFLSSEPYPFKEKHLKALQAIAPNSEVKLVDGEMFSWYGSRLRLATAYFQTLM